ncbi:MAG: GNAT family N-acetyltransferase [Nocardioidaceae bacterium]
MSRGSPSPATVVPLAQDTWPQFEELFGPDGVQGGCWCAFFRMTAREFNTTTPDEHKQVVSGAAVDGRPLGLLAIVDGSPQGWVAVSPRLDNPRLLKSEVARTDSTEHLSSTWAVTCFYIRRTCRRSGVSRLLLNEAGEYARRHGARAVEGYPVDAGAAKVAAAELYHGELGTFVDAGFALIDRRGRRRALVRKLL